MATVRYCIRLCLLLFALMTLLFLVTGQVSSLPGSLCFLVATKSSLLPSYSSALRKVIRAMNMNNPTVASATVIVTRVRPKACAIREQKSTIVTAFSPSHWSCMKSCWTFGSLLVV